MLISRYLIQYIKKTHLNLKITEMEWKITRITELITATADDAMMYNDDDAKTKTNCGQNT